MNFSELTLAIPKGWRISKVKREFSFSKGLSITKEDLELNGLPVINYGPIHSKLNQTFTLSPILLRYVNEQKISRKSALAFGDFVFADTSEDYEGVGNCVLIDMPDTIYAGYHTIVLKANDSSLSPYLSFLFQTDAWRFQLRSKVYGIKVFSITQHLLRNCDLLIPPLPQQNVIVSYLRFRCARINDIIALEEQSIEKLKAYKQSLITEVVTKGLDPNVEMKDSGMEWIGKVPKHWEEVALLRYIPEVVDYRGKTPNKTDEGVFLVTAKNIKNGCINYSISREFIAESDYQSVMHRGIPKIGDLLFTTEAPLGEVALVDKTNIALAQRVIKFSTNLEKLLPEYLKFQIISSVFQTQLQLLATGSTAKGIKASKLNQLRIVVPSILEQQKIATYLNGISEAVEAVIDKKMGLINKLQTYKKSLIYEVVTGKREVL